MERKPVVIKHAPFERLKNEINSLKLCAGVRAVRQLLDLTSGPSARVLEHLNTSLYAASCIQKLRTQDVKQAVKGILEGLVMLHAHKRAYLGKCLLVHPVVFGSRNYSIAIQPDSILANRGVRVTRFSDIQLSEFGDSLPQEEQDIRALSIWEPA